MTVGLTLLCSLSFFRLRRSVSLVSILCMTSVSETFAGDYSSYEARENQTLAPISKYFPYRSPYS